MRGPGRDLVLIFAFLLFGSLASAQQAPVRDDVGEARRLRDTGNFGAAVTLLRSHLAQSPDDGEAARLLAQTLYWMKDVPAARSAYESALARHPEDTTLALDYARMLAETGERERARRLIDPLTTASLPATRARAHALLGTMARWDGDLPNARRLFGLALEEDPGQQDARRQLDEILAGASPWVRVSTSATHDDQPLNHASVSVEARTFLNPLVPLTVRFEPAGYWESGSATRKVALAEATIGTYTPSVRIETEFAAGAVYRSYGSQTADWLGHGMVGVRVTPTITLRGRVERAPYFYTTASLSTPVMTESYAGSLNWKDPRGFLGEASYQRQRFPDGNFITSAYAWLLVPLAHRGGNDLQLGYAVAFDTADQSRFVLANTAQPYPPGNPLFDTAGVYAPYYTPTNVLAHSAIGAVVLRPSTTTTIRLNGSVAVRATEDDPALVVSGGEVVRMFSKHTLSLWRGRGSVEFALSPAMSLALSADFGRSAFYSWATAAVQVTRRFGAAARSGTAARQ